MQFAKRRLLMFVYACDENHTALGYQCQVAAELYKNLEHLTVITYDLGKHQLPDNCQIYTYKQLMGNLPVWAGGLLLLQWNLIKLCLKNKYDFSFVHMAVNIIPAILLPIKLFRLPLYAWYEHRNLSNYLKFISKFVNRFVSASPEGCRLPRTKATAIGHAIDLRMFPDTPYNYNSQQIICVGRIAASKRIDLAIKLFSKIDPKHGIKKLVFIGKPLTPQDETYLENIKHLVKELKLEEKVVFTGHLNRAQIPEQLQASKLMLNLGTTGLDKVVLEALAMNCPVLSCNPCTKEVLKKIPFHYSSPDLDELNKNIDQLLTHAKQNDRFRQHIENYHDLASYPKRLLGIIAS